MTKTRFKHPWLYDLLFLLVLVLAGYLRLTGVNWGEGQHQHPDENFLSGVLASLQAQKCSDESIPVEACPPAQKRWLSIGEYFDSSTSTLNPYNRGYTFFVYGNLPITIVRIAASAAEQIDVKMLGRQFSALADLFTILLLYFIVSRMYGRHVGLLAALFSTLTVMQIQQSHFFTTDLFVNVFAFLAIYFAVAIVDTKEESTLQRAGDSNPRVPIGQAVENQEPENGPINESQFLNNDSRILHHEPPQNIPLTQLIRDPLFLLSMGFGVAYGMALASKVNIFPLALLLPAAFALRYLGANRKPQTTAEAIDSVPPSESRPLLNTNFWLLITICLLGGALASLISFRIFQPYAFDGLKINPSGSRISENNALRQLVMRTCHGIYNGRDAHICIRSQT